MTFLASLNMPKDTQQNRNSKKISGNFGRNEAEIKSSRDEARSRTSDTGGTYWRRVSPMILMMVGRDTGRDICYRFIYKSWRDRIVYPVGRGRYG